MRRGELIDDNDDSKADGTEHVLAGCCTTEKSRTDLEVKAAAFCLTGLYSHIRTSTLAFALFEVVPHSITVYSSALNNNPPKKPWQWEKNELNSWLRIFKISVKNYFGYRYIIYTNTIFGFQIGYFKIRFCLSSAFFI